MKHCCGSWLRCTIYLWSALLCFDGNQSVDSEKIQLLPLDCPGLTLGEAVYEEWNLVGFF